MEKGRKAGESIADKFWRKVQITDNCWLWIAYIMPGRDNYGMIRRGHRMELAHRISWEIHFGPIPDGAHVLHHCDNPPCVNPLHLWLGTDQDNTNDMIRKGRKAPALKGEAHPNAKLTDNDAAVIRAIGLPQYVIADRFGVSKHAIYRIQTGKGWKHVK